MYTISVHPDGSLLYTGDFGSCGMIWDIRTGKAVLPLHGHVGKVLTSDFHMNGYHLVTGGNDNQLRFYDIRKKNCFKVLPAHNKLISHVEFSKTDGFYFLTSSYDTTSKIWSLKD